MTTTESDHRTLSEVPVRRLTAEQIEARRNHPVGTPEERAERVRDLLASPMFTLPDAVWAAKRPAV